MLFCGFCQPSRVESFKRHGRSGASFHGALGKRNHKPYKHAPVWYRRSMSSGNTPSYSAAESDSVSTLHHAGTYQRRVNASLERIWENVLDWEHLAHLHDGSFAECELVDRGPWGWCVDLTPQSASPQRIELRANRAEGHYTSTTIAGVGMGTEIRVKLDEIIADTVDVTVEFHFPGPKTDRMVDLGKAYSAIYAKLWDEDEAMMQARERALARPTTPDRSAATIELGDECIVRNNLPLPFELGGMAFHLVEHDGDLIAHTTLCPHWLGPLRGAPVNGKIMCPWHGYVFDALTRRCEGKPALRLLEPPAICVTNGRVVAKFN